MFARTILLLISTFASVIADDIKCGQTPIQPTINGRVTGGTEAVPYSWPWMIALCQNGWFGCDLECGGTIVAPHWIMTAGHCVQGSKPSQFRVKSGVFKQSKDNEAGEVVHKVKALHLHPKYQEYPQVLYDIALLELEVDITYDNHTQPLCLPLHDNSTIVAPNVAWAMGWGATDEIGDATEELHQVELPFINITDCEPDYPDKLDPVHHICAGKKGLDTCEGDAGDPLVVKNKAGYYFQYGITSFGEGCGQKEHPGIYARVTTYCDWINTTTNGVVTCRDADIYS
uniref:limulus clotting factor C n=1 Tax=Panagrellus redivivus TaxID=6233 RepID=A0A7E4VYY0_PANRE